MVGNQIVAISELHGCTDFWVQWQEHRDYLSRCCIKWMGGNPTDAEDALSRAMLKAWEKLQKYAKDKIKIANFKAWLTRLTHHLCVDIHREHSRSANRVEEIEAIPEESGLFSFEDTPLNAIETDERKIVIRHAIDNLPTRLGETFILHFYYELSYLEIAQQQDISYQNVCKRISQARAILRENLRGYFIEADDVKTELSITPLLASTECAIRENSLKNALVESLVAEMVTISVVVQEEKIVVDEESIKVVQPIQHSELVSIAATSQRKLKINSDDCQCIEVGSCKSQSRAMWILAQFYEDTGSWWNLFLVVKKEQRQPNVRKGWGEFILLPRSPPLYFVLFSLFFL
jgi:RNA polymerase sigma factor (sigma-70 family)